MANYGNDVVLEPAGKVITTSAAGSVVLAPMNKGTLRAALAVTAASGTTPSLTVTVQTSYDAGSSDAWRTVAAFTAATAAGTERKSFPGLDRYVRLNYTVSGTNPSITFGVSGEIV